MKTSLVRLLLSVLILFGWGACTANPLPQQTPGSTKASLTPTSGGHQLTLISSPTPSTAPTTMNAYPSPTFPSASPTPATCSMPGTMIQSSLESNRLRHPMDYRVYLPPCYGIQPDQRYPVLYLIHGQSYTDDQWDRLGADEVAEQLILSGEIAPFLIVMPRDRLWEQPKDDPFGEVFMDELIPSIDRSYQTIPQRSYRAIGGLSRGAGWAVHLGLRYWQSFGSIGAHSLAVFESDAGKIEQWLDEIPPELRPRIFLDIGDRDRPPILQSAVWFEGLLTRKHIPHEWYLYSGYHQEAYWQAHVEQYIRWYADPWSEAEFDIIEP